MSSVAKRIAETTLDRSRGDLIDPVLRAWLSAGIRWWQIEALRSADLEIVGGGLRVAARFRGGAAAILPTGLSARLMVWMVETGNIGTPERLVLSECAAE